MQGPPPQFFWQVPPWQFWLVQSPPQTHEPPVSTGLQEPETQDPLVQSASHPHGGIESAHTGAQTPGDPPLRSQNRLVQSLPQVQGAGVGPAQAGVVLRQAHGFGEQDAALETVPPSCLQAEAVSRSHSGGSVDGSPSCSP